jgi:hypothetical protein
MEEVADMLEILLWICTPITFLLRALREERDNNKIVALLESRENGWIWRSTHAISVKTNIPEDQVRQLCGWHNRIRRSEEKQEMWRLEE